MEDGAGFLATSIYLFLVTVAGLADITARVIPNWITFSMLALGLFRAFERGGLPALGFGLAVGAVIGFAGYLAGGIGGGDLKLFMAMGPWLGYGMTPVLVATAAAGVLYAAAVSGQAALERARNAITGLHMSLVLGAKGAWRVWEGRQPLEVPYGACVAAASWACVLLFGVRC